MSRVEKLNYLNNDFREHGEDIRDIKDGKIICLKEKEGRFIFILVKKDQVLKLDQTNLAKLPKDEQDEILNQILVM